MKKRCKSAAIAVILLLAFALVSCASAVEPELFDEDFLGTTTGLDLGGYELIYGTGIPLSQSVLGYEPDTLFADLAMKRIEQVENDLNCKITVKNVQDMPHAIVTSSASGTYLSDTFDTLSDMIAEVARLGMMYGLSSLTDYLDFHDEQKWGYRNMLEVVYYEDDLYAVCPMMWPEVAQRSFLYGLIVNENIIRELAVTDPRDYIENNEWTWAQFRQCLGDYYVEEGGQVKYYSLASRAGDFGQMFIRSNGDKYVKKEPNGTYSLGFYSKTAIDAMEEAKSIFNDYSYAITEEDALTYLLDGRTVMGSVSFLTFIGNGSRISKEMDNYGLLSWPVGPAVDPSYKFSIHLNIEGSCVGFSKVAKDIGAAAMIIDRLYEPFEDYDTPEKIKDYMAHNYFFDSRDADVFFGMVTGAQYNYFHWPVSAYVSKYMTSGDTVTETIEANRQGFETETEKYIMPSVRGIIALWGDYQ